MTIWHVLLIVLAIAIIWNIGGIVKGVKKIIDKRKNPQENKTSESEVVSCEVQQNEEEDTKKS